MTAAAREIIENFGSLADAEKQQVLATLLRSVGGLDFDAVSDSDLVATADQIFLDYDQREGE